MVGLNNIELFSDRSAETNFREIAEVRKRWPNHAVIASLMVDTRENWHDFIKRSANCGADGIELNFGCPHGICEREMGSVVGQNPSLNYKRIAEIDYGKCIGCNICYTACEDGAHQAIALADPSGSDLGPGRVPGKPVPEIKEAECVGCNLCSLVCPVHGYITMVRRRNRAQAARLGGLPNASRRRHHRLPTASLQIL